MIARRPALVLVAAALALVAAVGLPSVRALEQEGMTISEGQTVEATYGPIPGNNAVLVHYPDTCQTATYCDNIPLDVIVPADLEDADDFIVKITLSWPEQAADTPGYRGSSNDLDMYVYDDKQTETANPPEDGGEPGYSEKTSGASDQNPEVAQLFRPTLGRYNIVVNNFLGTNVGYTIKLEWQAFDVAQPFEMLAPPPGGSKKAPPSTTSTSTTSTTTAQPSSSFDDEPEASIPDAAVLPDDDFEGGAFDAQDDMVNDLASLDEVPTVSIGKPDPPSATAVLLWMVVLPMTLLGGAFVLLARRRAGRNLRPATVRTS